MYQYPLITRGYHTAEFTREFAEELRDDPPAVIVDTGHPYFPRLDPARREVVELPDRIETRVYEVSPPSFAAFLEQLDRDYQMTFELERRQFFQPRGVYSGRK